MLAARRCQLVSIPGVNETAANLIEAARAALRWAAEEQIHHRELFSSTDEVHRYLRTTMRGNATEVTRGLFLNRKNRLIQDVVLATGTVDHSPLYPREVVKRALELAASAIIMVHNHPSGDPTPSQPDIDMTKQVVAALGQVGIAVHDHIIVGKNRHTSFRTQKLL